MIRFEIDDKLFSYRVAGVILHEQHVLLQGEPQGTSWTLPGGTVELLESSHTALKRELREELGIDIRIERQLWLVEQFFATSGKSNHELGLYFLVTPLQADHLYTLDSIFQGVDGIQGEIAIIFRWFKLHDLPKITLYPRFLPTALHLLPTLPEHIVLRDGKVVS